MCYHKLSVQLSAETPHVKDSKRLEGRDSTACPRSINAQRYFFRLSERSGGGIRYFRTEFSEAILSLESCELLMRSRILGTLLSQAEGGT